MGASGEMFLRMREDDFNALPQDLREQFTYVEKRESDEYETHKDDSIYVALKKAESKAKKETQEYLFNKRHK